MFTCSGQIRPERRSTGGFGQAGQHHGQRDAGLSGVLRVRGESGLARDCPVVPERAGDQAGERARPVRGWNARADGPADQELDPERHRDVHLRAVQLHRDRRVR